MIRNRVPGYLRVVRPAGQGFTPPVFRPDLVLPGGGGGTPSPCEAQFSIFRSANPTEYATQDLAKAAFAAISPDCAAWAFGTSAPPPAVLTQTQCATYWDGWSVANSGRYPDKMSALAAFAAAYPACVSWTNAQQSALQSSIPPPPPAPIPVGMSTGTKVAIAAIGLAVLGGLYLFSQSNKVAQ